MATGRVPTTANSPLTAKGDLFGYSTTQARVAVGNDGETLVADSSTSTGLRYQSAYNGNGIINGGMDIWQRGTSFALTTPQLAYTADRWMGRHLGTNVTYSQQASGLTGIQYSLRIQRPNGTTGTNEQIIYYQFETADSYRYAGQTVTLSFWAKAGANFSATSSTMTVGVISGTGTNQNVGNGAYTGQAFVVAENKTLTTSWQRFTATGTVSASATQIGIYFTATPTGTAGANDWFEITGAQLELGSVPTSFKRSGSGGGTIQGELAACLRYYEVCGVLFGYAFSADSMQGIVAHSPKRVTPTVGLTTSTPYGESPINVTGRTGTTSSTIGSNPNVYGGSIIRVTGFTGMTAGTNAYVNQGQITLNAEL